ncbi:MAG TPA: 3-phosphoshikimate 1-carboxyvinyltransferase [Thermoplasmata archaeon]|nr:3-phosphoshikimate 1-carboxyvinyltransferase [Thermoplasmata archaeon]
MTVVRIRPGPVLGTLRAPPSKSYTHRALVVAHLAGRPFTVDHPLPAEDTRTTATALARLGSSIVRSTDAWRLRPMSSRRRGPARLDCRESGTTFRFLTAVSALEDQPVILTGSPRLAQRPIDELLRALTDLGARCRHIRPGGLPIEVRGPIHGGTVSLVASQSSQFASALLLVLPTLDDDSTLELQGPVVSEPYLDATVALLAFHGIAIERKGLRFRIPGRQEFRGSRFRVPGDASSAAYLWAAATLGGGTVRVRGVPRTWPQADLRVLDLIEKTGAAVRPHPDGATVTGGNRRPFRIDLTDAPDLYPLAGVLAATVPGRSNVLGASHVVAKESDRRAGTVRLARQLGARVRSSRAGLVIDGTASPRAISLTHETDHRMVMSAAVGALAAGLPSHVGRAESVRKSYPGFWDALTELSRGRQRW